MIVYYIRLSEQKINLHYHKSIYTERWRSYIEESDILVDHKVVIY